MSNELPVVFLARHGETLSQVKARADRVVSRIRAVEDNVLVFSDGHFIGVLTTRWLGLDSDAPGRHFMLETASLSAVGYEHNLTRPVIRLWNDDRPVGDRTNIPRRKVTR